MTSQPGSGFRAAGGAEGPVVPEISLARQLAHDARSPVSALVVLAESLAQQLEPVVNGRQAYQLKLLRHAAASLDQLLGHLVELTGPSDEMALSDRKTFSVGELLSGVHDLLLPFAELHNVRIDRRGVEPDRRSGYPAALSQTLFALASIPLREGGRGAVELLADVETGAPERVTFTVGSGRWDIDPDTVASVEAVALGREPRNRACLANLGLELSFRLVDLMGSSLALERWEGDGARFSFTLPLPPSTGPTAT
jgi:signal transduction histidine kinase